MKLFKTAVCFALATATVAMLMLPVAAANSSLQTQKDSLPACYSSADAGYVTSVKNQGATNACWAYAAMAACESSMIIHNGYDTSLDLSELLTAYAGYNKNADKMGMFDSSQRGNDFVMEGNRTEFTIFALANQQGVVKESANHGQFSSEKLLFDSANIFRVIDPETMYTYNEAYVTDAYKISFSNPDLVKEYIIKFGAGTAEHANPDEYYNVETGAYFCYENSWPNHAVAVVGWDDNYPRENFNTDGSSPENNGAWLIKNSFGTEHGNNGYNWVSYEDTSITMYPAIFYKLSENGTYTNAYQYDDLSLDDFYWDETNGMSFEGGAYMANVFTAQKDNETLEAVSFYTLNEDLEYKIEIYTDVQDESDPTKGSLKATLNGKDLLKGYHTVKLDEQVALNKGEKFSVVINLKDEQNLECAVFIATDGTRSPRDYKSLESGESFFSRDGKSWTDLCGVVNGNMRIKAFTNSDETPVEIKDYYTSAEGKPREEIISELEATLKICRPVFENPQYEENFMYDTLLQHYSYAANACEKTDIFLATELFELNDSIKYYYTVVTGESCPTLPPATDDENDADILGDATCDGKVNIKDATEIQKHIAGLIALTETGAKLADADANTNVNIKDATAIQKHIASIETGYPIGKPVA